MKRLLIFDDDGFYVDEDIVQDGYEVSDNQYLAESDEIISYYKPKLVDGQIVEGKTEEEFLEDEFLASLQPSQNEVEKAERQLEAIELLIELEVI